MLQLTDTINHIINAKSRRSPERLCTCSSSTAVTKAKKAHGKNVSNGMKTLKELR
ncbi:MAG: hypothetical protein LBS43_08900 [Prevotellaceae bacterium]|nr:hypothetical protein [Prevotellaceae bacterium]